ncbi:hypothetical protein RJ641_033253 [Dillenia turbinata]|uniref:Uncharacterized protein n=1 Tax=Dillenia turbinata TaxID=194707 RepID=A0AAN8VXX3_9MAGN
MCEACFRTHRSKDDDLTSPFSPTSYRPLVVISHETSSIEIRIHSQQSLLAFHAVSTFQYNYASSHKFCWLLCLLHSCLASFFV